MIRRTLKVLLALVLLLALVVGVMGYRFYNAGEDYGQQRQTASSATRRQTRYGDVIGFVDSNESHTWMGIPYAAAPVGELRWRAPRVPAAWNGTLEALQTRDFCSQYGSQMESRPPREWGTPIGSEDCLYLNVFAPAFAPEDIPTADERLPVMVYIHGGGNVVGYASQYKYSGTHLAKTHDVIVVNFNYRLGPFGWFSHPALNADGTLDDRSGNYGNLDTIRAFEWVQNNIEAFGGDPGNVTLFGESAGGMNAFVMLASPRAKGLFHKAIIQSGITTATTPRATAQNHLRDALPGDRSSSREIVNSLLVADGTATTRAEATVHQDQMSMGDLSSYLRSKSAHEILGIYEREGPMGLARVPTLIADGVVIPEPPLMDVFTDSSSYNAVPTILGSNRDEFKMLAMGNDTLMERRFGILPRVKDEEHFEAFTSYMNDYIKANGVDEVAIRLHLSQGDSVYAYRFDWDELPTLLGTDLKQLVGAAHASELPFVFGMFDDNFINGLMFNESNTAGRDRLSANMSSYWAEFAYASSPGRGRNGQLPEWSPWNETSPDTARFLVLDDESDGGIRMSSDAVTMAVLRERLLTDTRFPDEESHSQMYDCLLKDTDIWREHEFEALGGSHCANEMFDRR